jgi:hypothetical protein
VYDDGAAGEPDELGTDSYDEPEMSYDSYDSDMVVDTDHGPVTIGPATVDTDGDGHADTTVVHDVNGDTVLYTDAAHDGHADIATEFTPDGQVIVADHTDHGWVEARHTTLEGASEPTDGTFTPPVPATDDTVTAAADDAYWSGWAGAFSDAGSAQGVVRIDATTGQWISSN